MDYARYARQGTKHKRYSRIEPCSDPHEADGLVRETDITGTQIPIEWQLWQILWKEKKCGTCGGIGWRAGVIKGGLPEQVPFKLSWEEEEGTEHVKDAARGRD